jgi:hypothetical protein
MTQTAYTIRQLQNGTATTFAGIGGGDWFHATVATGTNSIWAEQSTPNGSRTVRLGMDAAGKAGIVETEAEDAEQPVVSQDGQILAFLRPVKGRNALWARRIGPTIGIPERAEPREIAGEEYDVHEAAFLPGHRLIFSSKQSGRFALYVATWSQETEEIEELKKPTCSARYPAISPDGRWLAFTCEQGGSAQLHVTSLEGDHEEQLTSGDCNSISPAWTADSKNLVYATDCGRGLGLTALARVTVFP